MDNAQSKAGVSDHTDIENDLPIKIETPHSEINTVLEPTENERGSAEGGNEYVQSLLDSTERYDGDLLMNTAFEMLLSLSRIFEEHYDRKQKNFQADSKLRRLINSKKNELGIKTEYGQFY